MSKRNEPNSNAKEFERLRQAELEQQKKADASKVQDRRYVGTKESLGFVIWDAAQSFNINIYSNRFITSIVASLCQYLRRQILDVTILQIGSSYITGVPLNCF